MPALLPLAASAASDCWFKPQLTQSSRPAAALQTILNPTAADEYAARSRRGGGGSGGGGPPRPPRGPRITGLGDLRDASGGEASLAVSVPSLAIFEQWR